MESKFCINLLLSNLRVPIEELYLFKISILLPYIKSSVNNSNFYQACSFRFIRSINHLLIN